MYSKFETIFSRVTQAACTFFLAAIFVMFLLNVFVRFVPVYNFTQTDDWIQFCLIWMIFLAAAELVRTKNHFVVDVAASQIASPAVKRWMRVAVLLIELVTYVVICWYGVVWVMRSNAHMQSIPWMEVRYVYLAIPVSAFFMAVFAVKQLGEAVLGRTEPTATRD